MLSTSAPVDVKRQRHKSMSESLKEPMKKKALYKTEWCRTFEETGSCPYGPKCQFAHSEQELRTIDRHPRYKTEMCKTYWEKGTCPYGKRCVFIHSPDDESKNSPIRARSISTGFEIKKETSNVEQAFGNLSINTNSLPDKSNSKLFDFDGSFQPATTPVNSEMEPVPDLKKSPSKLVSQSSSYSGSSGATLNQLPSPFATAPNSPFPTSPFKSTSNPKALNNPIAKVLFSEDQPAIQNQPPLSRRPATLSIPLNITNPQSSFSATPFAEEPLFSHNGSFTALPESTSFFPESFNTTFSNRNSDIFGRSFESFKEHFGTSLESNRKIPIQDNFSTSFVESSFSDPMQFRSFNRPRKGFPDVWGPSYSTSPNHIKNSKPMIDELYSMDEVVESLVSPPSSPK